MSAFVCSPTGSCYVIPSSVKWRKDKVLRLLSNINENYLSEESVYFSLNGRLVRSDEIIISENDVLRLHYRLPGGKGGFGSMLRAIGAQIEKTTSREACRDLSGRRMRDVNDEKKITEWVAKQADRERELAKQKQERLERRRAMPKHNFDDQTYTKEIQKNLERIDDALKQGLQASSSSTSSGTKRKGADTNEVPKKRKMWLDMASDDSDDESSTSLSVHPSTSTSTSTISKPLHEKPSSSSDSGSSDQDSEPQNEILKEGSQLNATDSSCALSSNLDEDRSSKEIINENNTRGADTEEQNTETKKPFCIDDYNTAEELESIGLDVLKEQLMILGLKCGGTLQERAQRLFSTKGKSLNELDPSLFAKPSKGKKKLKKK